MNNNISSESMVFKLAVLGGGAVGKSALTLRLVTDNFLDEYDPTIEDSYRKTVKIDDQTAILDILDTAGQQEFYSMQHQWIQHGEGFLLVYSITDRTSFQEIPEFVEKIRRTKEDSFTPIVIVGNKCDARQDRLVEYSEGQTLAEQLGCSFYEASAKMRLNNEACFFDLVRDIRRSRWPNGKPPKQAKFCSIL